MWHSLGQIGEYLIGMRLINRIYNEVQNSTTSIPFTRKLLDQLAVQHVYDEADLAQVPQTGALLVIANHPFGGIEGLLLLDILKQRRPDVKIMVNYLLESVTELGDSLILVDPFGTPQSPYVNMRSMKQALFWLREGHTLIIFPAGEVASFNYRKMKIVDPSWRTNIASLLRFVNCDVTIQPIYIPGRNSIFFQLAGLIHPRLRTVLLPRQLLRQRKRKIELRFGSLFSSKDLSLVTNSDLEVIHYLRLRTMILAERGDSLFNKRMQMITLDGPAPKPEAVIGAIPPEIMQAEIATIPKDMLLIETGDMQVWCIMPTIAPAIINEIGRLREVTFRTVGEGSGKKIDLDEFDLHYRHLFIWNQATREVVGSYRLGLTDEIIKNHGIQSLYTRTLFKFDERFLQALSGPALELGRSFVRREYQRSFLPLLLLWRGVMRFASLNPHYTTMFGPVSITHEFNPASRDIIISYLANNCFNEQLAPFISARLPPKTKLFSEWRQPEFLPFFNQFNSVSSLIREIEHGKREMPVLIKQYIKLGGQMLCFNVDPEFKTVDGMIMINLLTAPIKTLGRYMGKDELTAYLAYHDRSQTDTHQGRTQP